MGTYNEVEGNLITLAREGHFDAIAHGCNCFCTQKKGLATQMVAAFATDTYPMEAKEYKGDVNKIGQIEAMRFVLDARSSPKTSFLDVVNAYTQFGYGNPKGDIDYEALTLVMRKLASRYFQKRVGLPQIGAGLAGGDWNRIKEIIQKELAPYCDVTVVIYKQ
jgi:O-acetyl-ADP-ribose deacetylase (regulator of RNase III)